MLDPLRTKFALADILLRFHNRRATLPKTLIGGRQCAKHGSVRHWPRRLRYWQAPFGRSSALQPLWSPVAAPSPRTQVTSNLSRHLTQKTSLSPMSSPVTVAKSPLRYCSLMIRGVDLKCGGPIEPAVAIFI